MKSVKIQCPAKINLDLKVFKKDNITGFHPIKSTMQTISLYDYITICLTEGEGIEIKGNSNQIPYDEKNICYGISKLFIKETNLKKHIEIYIEKNIPVCAGLAGGSTDAAGVLYGLNILSNNLLSKEKLHSIASKAGSDLNFCLEGSTQLCEGKGDILTKLDFFKSDICLVKPKNLKISAKEAYEAFDNLDNISIFKNDLEFALINKYEELRYLHSLNMQMSGSGPTFFILQSKANKLIDKDKYQIIENLHTINHGVRIFN